MSFPRFWINLLFLLAGSFAASGQILDDSSKMLYSVKTVKYRTDSEMASGTGFQQGDSSLTAFSEKGDFLHQNRKMFQNLGVFGSAARPLFYQLPSHIGLRNGMEMFDYLIPGFSGIRYYNTLSPYTDLSYHQGARQRAMLKATFSVNLNPGLNLTGHYQRLTAMRVLNVTQSEERMIDHHSAWISAHYQHPKKHYRIWGSYAHLNHLQYETGGGKARSYSETDSLFLEPEIALVNLNNNARNRELRNGFYLSQLWKPFKNSLFLRTSTSRQRQINRYTDPLPNPAFYGKDRQYFQKDPIAIPDTLFSDRAWQVWENTIFAGVQDSLQTTEVFIRRRDPRYFNNLQTFFSPKGEWIAGFHFKGLYKGNQAELRAEYLDDRQFDLQGILQIKGWSVQGRLVSFQPSVIQQTFISKNLIYQTGFEPSRALQFKGEKAFKLRKWTLRPSFEQILVNKGIAFDTSFQPFQSDKIASMQYLGLEINGQIRKRLFSRNQFIRVFQAGGRISQMPGYVYRSTHWYELVRNRKAYGVQIGFNLDWRYDWPSEVFQPLTGQWGLQNQYRIPPYFLFDAFAHIRIDRVRLYFKVHNTLQGLGSPGYFSAPFYPGQRRLFEFGLNWTFFD
jgi:hypothetical protein